MDFRFFQKLYERTVFDEVKVIGKDIIIDEHAGHILGLSRKGKQVRLYILEQCESLEEPAAEEWNGEAWEVAGAEQCAGKQITEGKHGRDEHLAAFKKIEADLYVNNEMLMERLAELFSRGNLPFHGKELNKLTCREQMKSSMKAAGKQGFFLHIRSMQLGEQSLEMSGATGGNMQNGDYGEAYLLFTQFLQKGWRVSEESPFYAESWKNLAITTIELEGEMEQLPRCSDVVQITYDVMPKEVVVEHSITLQVEQTAQIDFLLQSGCNATCYVNRVCLMDVWAEEEERFADPVYRERMLQYVSQEQLEEMKEQLFEGLAQVCPKGMCFPVIEYECTENVGLRFLAKAYLDGYDESGKGGANSILVMSKPKEQVGSHGLKLRTCVIQTPVEPETKIIEAELFSYTGAMEKRTARFE